MSSPNGSLYNQARLLFWKKKAMPVYLVHFITDVCFLKCKHCFVYKKKAKDELSLEEIDRMTRHLGDNLYSVLLTGGEPFQRAEIEEIIRLYYNNAGVKSIQIPTNGYLQDKIVPVTKRIVEGFPDRTFVISISFDGIGEQHDYIRGMKGIFEKAIDTYKQLQDIENHYPNFNLSANLTFSYFNQDTIIDTYNYILDELHGGKLTVTLVRDQSEDPKALQFSLEKYKRFIDIMRDDARSKRLKGYSGFSLSSLLSAQDIVTRQRNYETVKEKKFISPCYAAHLSGVIRSNGDIEDCEIKRRKMGNIREAGFLLEKIWLQKENEHLRRQIKEKKCFCTHECPNITNVLYNPSQLGKVMLELLQENIIH